MKTFFKILKSIDVKKIPEKIFLQIETNDNGFFEKQYTTWNDKRVNKNDVEYQRITREEKKDEHQIAFEENAKRKCFKVEVHYQNVINIDFDKTVPSSEILIANCNVFSKSINHIDKHSLKKFFHKRVIRKITNLKEGSFIIPYQTIEL